MKLVLLTTLFLLSSNVWATPESFEFWFISPIKTTALYDQDEIQFSRIFASNDDRQCQSKIGDDCFDPKYGIFPDPELERLKSAQKKLQDEKNKPVEDKYFSNVETKEMDCSKDTAWDLYCGKVKIEEPKKAKLEIWIDVSRTMSDLDYPDKNKDCFRKSFVKRLRESCSNVDISIFNSHLKELGGIDDLCTNVGFTEQNRLLSWINDSKARKLIVITGKVLATKGVADFIYSKGGKVKGDANQKELSGKDLLELVDSTKKLCR